ncbi:hypothetical protein ACIBH1_49025 [Nonomuraea sp. NPDC050663]|uniref:hypothetical protein n=1 Tax=Nonomuraea sp. NPDC050663 TaxID=3364370 RepID=UPI0037AD3510
MRSRAVLVTGAGGADRSSVGTGIEKAAADLGRRLIQQARQDEPAELPPFPSCLRRHIEAIIWALKNERCPERHKDGLWARISQRVLALNAAIWHNWNTDAPVNGH